MLRSVRGASFLMLALFVPLARADDSAEQKAAEKVEELGGLILRDDKAPGKPVVSVDFRGGNVTAAVLKRLSAFAALRFLHLSDVPITDAMLPN